MTFFRFAVCWTMILALGFPVLAATPKAPSGAQIRGVLLDQNGLPAVGYQVGLKTKTGDLTLAAPTGADGTFTLEGLPPDTYRLVAFGPDGAEFPVLAREVTLKPGQVERMEIRISGKAVPPGKGDGAGLKPVSKASGKGWKGWMGSSVGKVALVIGGAFAIGALATAASDDDDEDNGPPPSPSR